jgi:glycosyltransferase involved in cell wall biosynthesis
MRIRSTSKLYPNNWIGAAYQKGDSPAAKVSVVLTANGRKEYLTRTIESFLEFNTYPIEKFIITNDFSESSYLEHIKPLLEKNSLIEDVLIISDNTNKGQLYRIDQGYSSVKSDYIFHCEEDWEFVKSGFIEASLKILKNNHIFSVQLHGYIFKSAHDITIDSPDLAFFGLETEELIADGERFRHIRRDWNDTFVGFSFNPGLKRLKDYKSIGSYAQLIQKIDLQPFKDRYHKVVSLIPSLITVPHVFDFNRPTGVELEVIAGRHYEIEGFEFAITKDKYCKHIGETSSPLYRPS